MLLWWESDEATKLAVLYLDVVREPAQVRPHRPRRRPHHAGPDRERGPVGGRPAAGRRRAAANQTPAPASAALVAPPQLTRQALFEQAGVIAAANLGELLDTAALLASQPVPAGRRVAVVSNARGARCSPPTHVRRRGSAGRRAWPRTPSGRSGTCFPPSATVAGPVDTTALVAPGVFRRCLELAGADPGVDAVLALTVTTAAGNLVPEVSAARLPVPIAAAVMDQVEVVRLLPGLARIARPSPPTPIPSPPPAPSATPRATASGCAPARTGARPRRPAPGPGERAGQPAFSPAPRSGGWLPLDLDRGAARLLRRHRWPTVSRLPPKTPRSHAAARFGGPVALRADVPGLARKIDAGAVQPDLHGADEVRRGFRSLRKTFGDRLAAVIVQPMITGGVEVTISVLQEPVFGPLVLFGLSGAAADHAR